MKLDADQEAEIRDHRHRMRCAGRWGACFEVACYLEHRFGWRRRDGIYQLADGTPVFKHAWNETPDGWIVDGTADQFCQGGDIDALAPEDGRRVRYREGYTVAHNPAATSWLAGRRWIGEPDEAFWERRHAARSLGPGWWLGDDPGSGRAYRAWLIAGARVYPLFRVKLDEYRALGYAI